MGLVVEVTWRESVAREAFDDPGAAAEALADALGHAVRSLDAEVKSQGFLAAWTTLRVTVAATGEPDGSPVSVRAAVDARTPPPGRRHRAHGTRGSDG